LLLLKKRKNRKSIDFRLDYSTQISKFQAFFKNKSLQKNRSSASRERATDIHALRQGGGRTNPTDMNTSAMDARV